LASSFLNKLTLFRQSRIFEKGFIGGEMGDEGQRQGGSKEMGANTGNKIEYDAVWLSPDITTRMAQ